MPQSWCGGSDAATRYFPTLNYITPTSELEVKQKQRPGWITAAVFSGISVHTDPLTAMEHNELSARG